MFPPKSAYTWEAAGSIVLNEAGNLLGGAVSLSGYEATIVNETDLRLGAVDLASLDVTLAGGNAITQNNSGVRVSGASVFSAAGNVVISLGCFRLRRNHPCECSG